jgi:cobalt-zinc-cadmium efflux system outer membrane protein
MSCLARTRITTRRSKYAVAAALSFVSLLLSLRASAQTVKKRTLEVELTLRVCRAGPSLATANAERGLGEAEIGAIEPLQNPSLVVEHQQTLQGFDERETIVGAQIPVALSGRRGVLREAARARQRVSNARADADTLETALDFREAYTEAGIEQARVLVLREQQKTLESLTSVLEQLAARGESARYDVRRHQAEVRLHARTLASAEVRATAAAERLAIWLDQRVEAASLVADANAGASTARAETSQHPDVVVLRSTAEAAEREAEAASRRWVPEPEVFAGYRQVGAGDQTGHGVSLGVLVPLTFFEHGQGAASKARAERVLAAARAERLQRRHQAELRVAVTRGKTLEVVLREAEQTVKDAAELMDGARRLYGAGETSIAEVLDAYRTAEKAALDRLTALEELLAARLAVMRASGKQFDPELDAACGSRGGAVR